jgi:hypothetical protein
VADNKEPNEQSLKRQEEIRRAIGSMPDVSVVARSMVSAQDLLGPNIRSLSNISEAERIRRNPETSTFRVKPSLHLNWKSLEKLRMKKPHPDSRRCA